MSDDTNTTTIIGILNTVLKNINEDIKFLRSDFRKLNDLVLVMSIKVDETIGIKEDIKRIKNQINDAIDRIKDLESSKQSLKFLIDKVNEDSKKFELSTDETIDAELKAINLKFKNYDDTFPYLWKILLFFFALICIIIYVTKTYDEVLSLVMKIVSFL